MKREVVRGRRMVTAGVLASGLLLLTSCSVLGGGGELSQECEDFIADAANEFRDAIEPLSGDRIPSDYPDDLTFTGPNGVINRCEGEDQNEVASAYVMAFSVVTESFSPSSPAPTVVMASQCIDLLADSTIRLTQEAYDTCNQWTQRAETAIPEAREMLESAGIL